LCSRDVCGNEREKVKRYHNWSEKGAHTRSLH
jgi:hypothetical protein